MGLICTFGLCHGACVPNAANGDCPTGELCVKSSGTVDGGGSLNVCQLPAELKCVYNSDCTTPLICARDEQCRNQCQTDVDCVSGQVCTDSKVCALTSQLVQGTNDVKVVTAGLDGGAGATGTGGSSGTGGTGTGTGGTVTGTGGGAGAAGTTGSAGAKGTGGASATGGTSGAAGSSGGCSPACGIGKQCVTGTCEDCGASAEVCCGGSTPCGSNLVCSSANTCTCGAVSQPCCGGTSCTAGLSCLNGVCACGGAGQNCCAGQICSSGLKCGGLKCGCTASCDQSAAMKIDGSIWVSNTPVTNIDASLFKAAQFSYNGTFACGVKTDGTVWCWGNNTYGSLGNGDLTVTSSTYPLEVATDASGTALTGVTNVQVGDSGYSACAIATGGALWCWGYGTYGQLGTGFKNTSPFAVKVVDASSTQFTGAIQLAVSLYHACAVKSDHTLWCWGDNSEGQIGIGSSATTIPNPTQVTALFSMVGNVATTDTYYYNTCASTMDGSVYCWGGNGYGELGNGLMSGMALVPSQVLTASATPLAGVASVIDWNSAYKMCALKTDGTMWCWGTTTDLYAMPLTDNTSAQVTGITITGRDCYLDNGDLLWVNGAKSGYQITCN